MKPDRTCKCGRCWRDEDGNWTQRTFNDLASAQRWTASQNACAPKGRAPLEACASLDDWRKFLPDDYNFCPYCGDALKEAPR